MTSNACFISYRRETGAIPALALFQRLSGLGIDTFIDTDGLGSGPFGEALLAEIERRPYYLLVLTPGTLNRCTELGDWVAREIEHAVGSGSVILPLCSDRFSWGDLDRYLTPRMASALRGFNAVPLPQDMSPADVRTLVATRLPPRARRDGRPTSAAAVQAVRAVQAVERARALPPVTSTVLAAQAEFEKGQLLSLDGDREGAVAAYSEAIRLKPDFADAYNGRGAELLAHQPQQALSDFSHAVANLPGMSEGWQNRGCARLAAGDHDGAVQDFSEAIRLRPGYARALKNRAAAYDALKQPGPARADLDEAVRLGSKAEKGGDTVFRDALHQRALLRLKTDDDKHGAIDDLDRAILVDPLFAPAFVWRGMLRDALGDRDRAIADAERSRELEPNGEWQVVHYGSRNRGRRWPWQR